MVDEHLRYAVAVRLFVFEPMDSIVIETVDISIGDGKEDGRMRDNNILGAFSSHLNHAGEEGKLAVGREGRFGFVHQEQALS